MAPQSAISKPRFTLYKKLIGSFILIVVIMIGLSALVLIQLQRVFTSDQPEFRIIPMTQQIEHLFSSEQDLALKYFQTQDPYKQETLHLITAQFKQNLDSLQTMIGDVEAEGPIARLRGHNEAFEQLVAAQAAQLRENPHYDAVAALESHRWLLDSIRVPLRFIRESYIPTLGKSLKRLNEQTSNALATAQWIMVLALAIGIVFALILARNLTAPIQSLKAGTQKVAEGVYETVPITSNDEIADLTGAFNMMSDRLRQLDEMRMQLMSEISHEMRTPLQVIKAGCYTIIHSKDGAPLVQRQRDAVGMIHQATNRINQFINSFLDVAKMEAGLMKFTFVEADLVEVITPLVQEAQLIAQNRQITVQLTAPELPKLRLDRDRISQVFSNLLSNALKYTPDQGSITICIDRPDDCSTLARAGNGCVRIAVQDTGVGIPEEDLQKLFNKFFQAKNVPLVNEKGSGLGLALVKHVTEAHGGTVTVASTVGTGSTFTVLLPL